MTRETVDTAVREIFSDMFDKPAEAFSGETNPDSLIEWDSMAHVRLMAALEERFDIEISPEHQVDMLTFELIGDVIAELTEA